MNRTLISVVLALVLAAGLGFILMWYLVLGTTSFDDETIESNYLTGPGSIQFDDGYVIESRSEPDAYYMLGYAHGRSHAWTLTLLRQTAEGRLSEWFGEAVLPIDRLTRSLGFSSRAVDAAATLSGDDLRVLNAYARGITDAFTHRAVLLDDHLTLFNIVPEPWDASHSLAVERLFAWLSEPPERPSPMDTAHAALRAFQLADEALREWLHLHGFEHSSAWTIADSLGLFVQNQFIYGATALPIVTPLRLSWGETLVEGFTLIGAPFFPFAVGAGGTRITLLSSPRSLINRFAAGFPDSLAAHDRYERIVVGSGAETLLKVPEIDGSLLFSYSSFATDTVAEKLWGTLQWVGLAAGTDWPTWRKQVLSATGEDGDYSLPFRLVEGIGLGITAAGKRQVLGRPDILREGGDGSAFLAIDPLGVHAGSRFRSLVPGSSAERVAADVTSIWAETNVAIALSVLEADSTFSRPVRDAVDYLKNWDFRYNLSSIGAPIFDAWMGAYTHYDNPYPRLEIPTDSLARAQFVGRLRGSLVTAVDSLVDVAGPDLARWRLEAFRTSERYFPAWSYPPIERELPDIDPLRYAPLALGRPGHPTTVAWESGLFDYPRNSPAHVLAAARMNGSASFAFRPDYRIGSGIIARHVVSVPGGGPQPFPAGEKSIRITFRVPR